MPLPIAGEVHRLAPLHRQSGCAVHLIAIRTRRLAYLSTSTIGSGRMRFPSPSVAACRSTPAWRILALMGTKSRESIYGSSVRHSAERAAEARKEADRLACIAWNQRMLGFKGPAQPSPSLGDALNARYLYLEVRCLGCDTHQTLALNIVRRAKTTPIHELERYMRCKDCSQVRGYPYKRSHLGTLRLFG